MFFSLSCENNKINAQIKISGVIIILKLIFLKKKALLNFLNKTFLAKKETKEIKNIK